MLDGFLAGLSNQGRLDSRGQFALDVAAEVKKLEPFLQAEPRLYLLRGVQAAVAAGAPAVDLTIDKDGVRMSFQADSPSLEGIFQSDSALAPWIKHLRFAVLGALATRPGGVTLQAGPRCILHYGSPVQRGMAEGITLEVRHPVRSWLHRFVFQPASMGIGWPREIRQRCQFCCVPVRLNRHLLQEGRPESLLAYTDSNDFRWSAEEYQLTRQEVSLALASPMLRSPGVAQLDDHASLPWESLPTASLDEPRAARFSRCLTGEGLDARIERVPVGSQRPRPFPNVDFARALPVGWGRNTLEAPSLLEQAFPTAAGLLGPPKDEDSLLHSPEGAGFLLRNLSLSGPGGLTLPCLRASWWMGRPTNAQDSGWLYYVEDGILLNPVRCEPGLVVCKARTGGSTDLSGLNPTLDAEVEADLRWVAGRAGRLR